MPGFYEPVAASFVNSILANASGYAVWHDTPFSRLNATNSNDTGVFVSTIDFNPLVDARCKAVVILQRVQLEDTAPGDSWARMEVTQPYDSIVFPGPNVLTRGTMVGTDVYGGMLNVVRFSAISKDVSYGLQWGSMGAANRARFRVFEYAQIF